MIVQQQKIVLNSSEVVSQSKLHWFDKKETFLWQQVRVIHKLHYQQQGYLGELRNITM